MQTTKIIYLVMWIFVIAPLVGFNMKRVTFKPLLQKRRIKWNVFIMIAALSIVISGFLFYAYEVTVDTRYELAAERYVDVHAEYITGQITYEEYLARTGLLLTTDADTSAMNKELAGQSKDAGKVVRFQVSSWIIPKYYKDNTVFPKTEVIDANNPVFVLYLIDDASSQTYYLIEMISADNGTWKIAYHAPATKAQVDAGKTALPSQVNGKWFYIAG